MAKHLLPTSSSSLWISSLSIVCMSSATKNYSINPLPDDKFYTANFLKATCSLSLFPIFRGKMRMKLVLIAISSPQPKKFGEAAVNSLYLNPLSNIKKFGLVHINPFPKKLWFLCVCSSSLLKTLWEKEKLFIPSNSPFPKVLSTLLENFPPYSIEFKIVICKPFLFEKFVIWERVKSIIRQ